MSNVLESEYKTPSRPYSYDELQYMRLKNNKFLGLGEFIARHKKCGHFYNVHINGKKEKQIKDTDNPDVGNCSVCWKLYKTPKKLKNQARRLVNAYKHVFETEPSYITYSDVDLEIAYYKWLYVDFN